MEKYAVKEIMKEHKGREYTFPIGVKAINVETDTTHQFITNEEKNKIGEIESIKQAFLDGCKIIVDRLTALGYDPVFPQGPEQIVASINIMHDDRYNDGYDDGRMQGQADVVANPGAYGISTGFYWLPCESTKKEVSRQVLLSAGIHHVYVVGQHFGNYESYCIIRNSAGTTLWEWHSTGEDQHIHTGYGEFNFSVAETVTIYTSDSSSIDMFFTSITIL